MTKNNDVWRKKDDQPWAHDGEQPCTVCEATEPRYMVVAANQVAGGVDELSLWLNEQAAHGWSIAHVDQGVIYLQREPAVEPPLWPYEGDD